MEALLTATFLGALLTGAITAGTPLLLAGLGEQVSEKSGVLNVGLEGMMLLGALAGFAAAHGTGSFLAGYFAGALAGLAGAAVMIVLCVVLRANQIVVGIAITLGAGGLTALMHHFAYSRARPRLPDAADWPIPLLAVALVAAVWWVFRHTQAGLNLQAAGDRPAALDAAGVSVTRTRAMALAVTGLLAGLGGAYMSTVGAGLFEPRMTGGAGFIAIVLAMLARGQPLWVLAGAFVFGLSLELTTALQLAGIDAPTDLVLMLPFALVLLMLLVFGRHSRLPPALGIPYRR